MNSIQKCSMALARAIGQTEKAMIKSPGAAVGEDLGAANGNQFNRATGSYLGDVGRNLRNTVYSIGGGALAGGGLGAVAGGIGAVPGALAGSVEGGLADLSGKIMQGASSLYGIGKNYLNAGQTSRGINQMAARHGFIPGRASDPIRKTSSNMNACSRLKMAASLLEQLKSHLPGHHEEPSQLGTYMGLGAGGGMLGTLPSYFKDKGFNAGLGHARDIVGKGRDFFQSAAEEGGPGVAEWGKSMMPGQEKAMEYLTQLASRAEPALLARLLQGGLLGAGIGGAGYGLSRLFHKESSSVLDYVRHHLPGYQESPVVSPQTDYGWQGMIRGGLMGGGLGGLGGYLAGPEIQHQLWQEAGVKPGLVGGLSKALALGGMSESPELGERLLARFLQMSPKGLAGLGAGVGAAGLGLVAGGIGNIEDAINSLQHKQSNARPMLKAAMVTDIFFKEAIVKREGNHYVLYSHKGKVLGKHPSKGKAIAQERAIKSHGG